MFKVFIICILIVCIANAYVLNQKLGKVSFKLHLFGNPEPPKASPEKKDGGLFGGMGNLMESMKKAQEIAKQAESVNKELANTIIIGQDPTGVVTTTFNGLGVPIGIKIPDSLLSQGSEAVSLGKFLLFKLMLQSF